MYSFRDIAIYLLKVADFWPTPSAFSVPQGCSSNLLFMGTHTWWALRPFPSFPFHFPILRPIPFLPYSHSFPSLPLRSRHLSPQLRLGGLGRVQTPPARPDGARTPNAFWRISGRELSIFVCRKQLCIFYITDILSYKISFVKRINPIIKIVGKYRFQMKSNGLL